jgi:hypothetical protein
VPIAPEVIAYGREVLEAHEPGAGAPQSVSDGSQAPGRHAPPSRSRAPDDARRAPDDESCALYDELRALLAGQYAIRGAFEQARQRTHDGATPAVRTAHAFCILLEHGPRAGAVAFEEARRQKGKKLRKTVPAPWSLFDFWCVAVSSLHVPFTGSDESLSKRVQTAKRQLLRQPTMVAALKHLVGMVEFGQVDEEDAAGLAMGLITDGTRDGRGAEPLPLGDPRRARLAAMRFVSA